MQVLNARTVRTDDGRTLLYAAPAFARLGGVWRAIDQIVDVRRDGHAYRVSVGDDWIIFAPRKLASGQVTRSVVTKRRFGDIIDASTKPEAVEYDVRFSKGVERTATGWRFKDVTDADLGVFLTDWQARFSTSRVTITDDRAMLDLTDVRGDARGEINLDPTTVSPESHLVLYGSTGGYPSFEAAWTAVRDGSGGYSVGAADDGRCMGHVFIGFMCSGQMRRNCMNFDTSAHAPTGKTCKLVLTYDDSSAYEELDDFGIVRVDPPIVEGSGTSGWTKVTSEADGGDGVVATNTSGSTWESPDLIAAGQYAQAADLQLAVLAAHDLNDAPLTEEGEEKGRKYDPATAYLEIADAASSGGMRPLIVGGRGVLGGPML